MTESEETFDQIKTKNADMETLIEDPDVLKGLNTVLSELDNLYSSLEDKPDLGVQQIAPGVFADGTFVAALEVFRYKNLDGEYISSEDEAPLSFKAKSDTDYLIFMFNLKELKDPGFKLKPVEYNPDTLLLTRSGHVGIELTDDAEKEMGISSVNLPLLSGNPYRIVHSGSSKVYESQDFKQFYEKSNNNLSGPIDESPIDTIEAAEQLPIRESVPSKVKTRRLLG